MSTSVPEEHVPEGKVDDQETSTYPAHFRNEEIHKVWRYGIPIYFMLVLGLLLASDIGSGVAAYTLTTPAPNDTFNEPREQLLLEASVFTSIKELWKTESYALTIFIVVMSVSWPYIKIFLSLFAWMAPIHNLKRRSRLLAALEALGKWSFVDVVVFLEIVVVFRSTIQLGGPTLDVWIVPQWGLFGFITATMLNLIGTHVISYIHRSITTKSVVGVQETIRIGALDSKHSSRCRSAVACVVLSIIVYLIGCSLHIFRVINSRGDFEEDPIDYSIMSLGAEIVESGRSGDRAAMRYMQIVWFLLGVAAPILSSVLLALTLFVKGTPSFLRNLFFAAEVASAWSCAEVYWVSTLFAASEIPKFGDGLIDEGCDTCYVVDCEILILVVVLSIGTVCHRLSSLWVAHLIHKGLFGER